jgi:hypothetical protein
VPPELGAEPPGDAPPVFGSTPPPLPLLGVPAEGVCGVAAGGVALPLDGAGVPVEGVAVLGVPPPEPPMGVPVSEPSLAFLFFFLSPGCTGSPVTGATGAGVVVTLESDEPLPPPLDATAITTIRKKTATTAATSRRRL